MANIKLIIWIPGRPNVYGFVRREFKWSEKHKCFIHGGKEYTPEEFNALGEQTFYRAEDMHPAVKAIIEPVAATPAPAPVVIPPPPAVATISAAREITEDEAAAVLMRLAPHRLRKAVGRPPAVKSA